MVVGFLVKPTTAVAWMPAYIAIAVDWRSAGFWRANRSRMILAVPLLAGLASAAIWTRVADGVKASNPFSAFLTSTNLTEWNFGTVEQRLDPSRWQSVLGYSEAIVGSTLILGALTVVAIYVWPRRPETIGLGPRYPWASWFFNLDHRTQLLPVSGLPRSRTWCSRRGSGGWPDGHRHGR